MNRDKILLQLLEFEYPLPQLLQWMSTVPWGSDTDLSLLKAKHVIHALNCYRLHQITKKDIKTWAETIEMREDIGIEETSNDSLVNILFELANPEITYELTPERANKLIASLSKSV